MHTLERVAAVRGVLPLAARYISIMRCISSSDLGTFVEGPAVQGDRARRHGF